MDVKIAGFVIVLILGNVVLGSCRSEEDSECGADCKVVVKAGTAVAGGAAAAAVTTAAGSALINAAGFTAAGVAKYSVAAAVHSAIGNVAAGSTFAALQSVGAVGGLALLGPVGVGVGVAGALALLLG